MHTGEGLCCLSPPALGWNNWFWALLETGNRGSCSGETSWDLGLRHLLVGGPCVTLTERASIPLEPGCRGAKRARAGWPLAGSVRWAHWEMMSWAPSRGQVKPVTRVACGLQWGSQSGERWQIVPKPVGDTRIAESSQDRGSRWGWDPQGGVWTLRPSPPAGQPRTLGLLYDLPC